MKKTFNFGKIAYNGKRKINTVTVTVEFESGVFHAMGSIYNMTHTNVFRGGQCLDTIAEYIHTPLFKKIYRLWKLYHNNDLHAGTMEQENAILAKFGNRNASNYKEHCDYLKSIGLYEVDYKGKPYKYGHGWLKHEIPVEDIKEIESLFMEV